MVERYAWLKLACLCIGCFSSATASAATVLMVIQNSSMSSGESARQSQIQSWGHSVTTIQDSASQGSFDAAVAAADVVYVPCTIDDWDLLYKLRTATKGVVTETPGLDTEFGFATSDGYTESRTQVYNLTNTHEVTAGLSSGTVTVTSSSQNLSNNNNTLAAGMQKLAEANYGGLGLGVMDSGSTLANTYSGNSTASGRRVRLPWGWGVSISSLNTNGLKILRQAIDWAIGKQLVARWKLDESSGTSAADATGQGHTGTVTGTASWTSAILKNGFSFNGSTKIQASGLMNNPKNVTLAAWANLTAADTSAAEVISLGDHVILRLDENGSSTKAIIYNGSSWISASLAQTFSGKGWHHFALVFDDDGNSLKLFVDGVQADSTSTTSSISYSGLGGNTVIGRHGDTQTAMDFTGMIDDVRVYNYALSATEVAQLYGFMGHWKLSETSGTTATDFSPVANNGTYVNGVALNQSGPYPGTGSKAASFDGNNDYVSVPNESKYDNITETVTVAAWIKVASFTVDYQTIVAKGDSAWRLSRNGSNDTIHFAIGGTAAQKLNGTKGVNDGRWHHVAGTYDGTTMRLYIDGQLDASYATSTTIGTNDYAVQIGRNEEKTGREWNGNVHDVRVYNRALNAWEIAQLYGLIGSWKLTETSGTSAADSSAATNNGTFTNGVTLNQSGPYPGAGNKAASFDGNNDYVAIPNETRYDITSGVALATWIKITAFSKSNQTILSKGDSAWRLAREGSTNTLAFSCTGLTTTKVVGSVNVNDGSWHHVAGVYDGSQLKLYVDGVLDNSASATGSISTNNYAAAIGRNEEQSNREFSGLMHDVRVYSRAINPSDVAELHGLVGRWQLSETSGTTATDSSLAANNGSYTNGVTLNTTGPKSGLIAAQFDGTNDYVTAPTQANFSKGFSIAVWARPTSTGSYARFADFGAGAGIDEFLLTRVDTSSTLQMELHGGTLGGGQTIQKTNAIALNAWHHYAGTVDSTGLGKLYVDGAEVASGTVGVPYDAFRNSNYIARSNWSEDAYYKGQMWDVRLYNRPLSPEEVQVLYQGGGFAGVKIIKWVEIQ